MNQHTCPRGHTFTEPMRTEFAGPILLLSYEDEGPSLVRWQIGNARCPECGAAV